MSAFPGSLVLCRQCLVLLPNTGERRVRLQVFCFPCCFCFDWKQIQGLLCVGKHSNSFHRNKERGSPVLKWRLTQICESRKVLAWGNISVFCSSSMEPLGGDDGHLQDINSNITNRTSQQEYNHTTKSKGFQRR